MKNFIKETIAYILIFMITVILLTGALIAIAKIPREAIRNNMLESAEYLASHSSRNHLINPIYATYTDQFADSILLNITYNFDSQDPLHSIIWAKFAGYPNQYAGQYFLESVRDGVLADHEYLRYWHGSAVFVRLLHLFFNLSQIYVFHAILIAVLLFLLIAILLRNGYFKEAVSTIISMIVVSIWTVPFCLEFTWVFLTMLPASIIAVEMALCGKDQWSGSLFLITGMVTVYLDFLTTETLSLFIPLLLILSIRFRRGCEIHSQWLFTVKSCILWLIGYGGMWAMKWLVSSIVLHQNVMQYVTGHISERQGQSLLGLSAEFIRDLMVRNISRLFPLDYGIVGSVVFFLCILLFMILIYQGKIQLRDRINGRIIALYAVIGIAPFIRFIVMNNHSYGHFTFTYRALATTVFAFCLIMSELMEWSPEKNSAKAVTSDD